MTGAAIAIVLATAVANGGMAAADLRRAPFVLRNAAQVGVPTSWVPVLGLLKGAGAAGLLLGVLGVPHVGTVAAAGLTLFFVGAVLTHLRAGDHALAFPVGYLVLATGSLVVLAGQVT